jgi:hypothetical protein
MILEFLKSPKGFVWVYQRYAYVDLPPRVIDARAYGLEGFAILIRKAM